MTRSAWFGLALMIGSEGATLARIEPFWSWNTPIAWTGFILCADAVVWRARGNSWMRSNPREFALLALASIPLWLVFEAYNLRIRNWYYTGLPESTALRLFGYAWSFATISPAIFEAAELVGLARRPAALPATPAPLPAPALSVWSVVSLAAGAVMLVSPFLVSADVARYLAAPVWLGFIFVLDPINARLGADSLTADLSHRRYDRLANLLLGGLLCGFLWEFWNYWSRTKWHYAVPMFEHTKLFEMPLPGYLGFPPFAVECFTMYVFVRAIVLRPRSQQRTLELGRTIAL
jgi:hypothetical protein